MDTRSAPPVGPVAHDLFACPACGGRDHEAVTVGGETNFRCVQCDASWHIELGWVRRVDHGR